jgi:hypothetical protein
MNNDYEFSALNIAFDALLEIGALACAALFLTDTPERLQIANRLMAQVEERAKGAQMEVEKLLRDARKEAEHA